MRFGWLIESDEELISALRTFNKIFNRTSHGPVMKEIGMKLENALLQLAKEDPLNKVRVEKLFGLVVNNDEGKSGSNHPFSQET